MSCILVKIDRFSRTNIGNVVLHNYKLHKTLGHGSFDKIKVVPHIQKGEKSAVKILNRHKISKKEKSLM